MNVTLDKTFPMPGAAETAWRLLQDIEGVAACMPGAKITERLDEQHFKGTVSVKFGPASMSFRGEIEVKAVDASTRTLRLVGKGTDSTGSSGASMDLTARIDAVDAANSNLIGHSEVSVSGKAAAFGGRMMSSVSDQVLKQFADNFAARVQALQSEAGGGGGAAGGAAAGTTAAPAPQPSQLNALALMWAIIRDWFKSLFAPKKA